MITLVHIMDDPGSSVSWLSFIIMLLSSCWVIYKDKLVPIFN
jgi:hypothetical protein